MGKIFDWCAEILIKRGKLDQIVDDMKEHNQVDCDCWFRLLTLNEHNSWSYPKSKWDKFIYQIDNFDETNPT